MSDAMEIGKKLVALCNAKKNLEAVDTLYAPNVVSIEAMSMPEMPARTEGIAAVREKNVGWMESHTIHSCQAIGPLPHGDRFIVIHKIDATAKSGPMAGKRMQMEEAGLYAVKNGKIVQEEYFYATEG